MTTPATIAITPGSGQLLDAVSLVISAQTVVRETMVIADPSNATNLATVTSGGALNVSDALLDGCITANVLAVSLPTAQITTLTPPTAAAIAAAIVANPPSVTITGNPAIVGTLTHNNHAPAATNIGALVGLANAAAPTYIEGDQVLLSTDLTGALRVNIAGSVVASNNITQWNSVNLGSPSAYGTGPGAVNVIGVNAFVTSIPAVTIAAAQTIAVTNAGTFAVQATLSAGSAVIGHVITDSGSTTAVTQATAANLNATVVGTGTFAVQATLSAETTKVIGTVNQGTSPWVVSNGGTFAVQATLSAETTKVIGTIRVTGNVGGVMDAVLGATKPANVLQVGGNDGTNAYGLPLASGGSKLLVTADAVTIAAAQKVEVYDGTNTATVKAAATAALASDTAVVVTEPGSTTGNSPANTAVTSSSSSVLASNVARRECMIMNTDVVTVYLGFGQVPTATSYHVALAPCTVAHDGTGGSYVSDVWKGAINAITASTSGHVAVTEMT